jgi:opacity protein-like surface antigen
MEVKRQRIPDRCQAGAYRATSARQSVSLFFLGSQKWSAAHRKQFLGAACGLFIYAASGYAATDTEEGLWAVGIAPLLTLNAKTSFVGYGGFSASSFPAAPGSGPSFAVYNDGFVLADISGDLSSTTNWGYNAAQQYDSSGGGSIALSSVSGIGTAGVREDADPAPGVEIHFTRRFPGLSGDRFRLGLDVALGVSQFDSENNSRLSADVNLVTDAFPLEGVIPPLAPYSGSFSGPGPLLGTTPTRSTESTAGGASVSGERKLDVDLYTLRIGPRLEASLGEAFGLYLGGGLALAYADGSYRFRSTASFEGTAQTSQGGGDDEAWLGGYFVEAGANWEIAEAWTFFGSLQHRGFEDFEITAGGTRSELSFDHTFTLAAGIRYSF